jgi:hypothetical protein
MKVEEQATVPTTKTGILTQISDWGLENKYVTFAATLDYPKLKELVGAGKQAAIDAFNTAMGDAQNVTGTGVDNTDGSGQIKEDFSKLISEDGQLTEETKTKISTLFEAAVTGSVSAAVKKIEEEAQAEIQARVDEHNQALSEKVDQYLNYVVAEWAETNRLAIENGIRMKIAEEFLGDLKGLFEKHHITVPADKENAFDKLAEEVETLKRQLNTQIDESARLVGANKALKKQIAFAAVVEGMSDRQKEKFKTLSESTEYTNDDEYIAKLNIIKEGFITEAAAGADKPENLNESAGSDATATKPVVSKNKYVAALSANRR